MTDKETAEAYVRGKIPELAFTVVCRITAEHPTGVRKSWRKPQLHHWLSVLPKKDLKMHASANFLYLDWKDKGGMDFDLNTGQPEPKEGYRRFNEIVEALKSIE